MSESNGMTNLRELELEYRWLADVERSARSARIEWMEKLARDLRGNIEKFYHETLKKSS